jgi:signal transduction histidine kinase
MKIFAKGLLLVAVPSLFQVVLLGILVRAQIQATEAEAAALRAKQVTSEAADVLVPMLLEANRVFGAVITNDISGIEQPAVWRDMTQRLDHLQALVVDNPKQLAAVGRMRRNVETFRRWTVQSRELLQQEQEVELVARFRNVAVQKELTQFRRELAEFQSEGKRIDRDSGSALHETRLIQRITLTVALLGALLAAALSAYFFSRSISVRLATVTDNAERLADGATLAARVAGNDEISRLDSVLHQTGARLIETERRARTYRGELEKRAIELATANEHLRQQTLDNDMFVYSVSHDLRSPLVNMQGFSKEIMHAADALRAVLATPAEDAHMRQAMREILNTDMSESLHFLQNAVLRTANIIDALLRLSRAGRLEYQLQHVDVTPIVQRVIDAMQGTVRQRKAQITLLPLPGVWGDPVAVDQIFGNLIGNAVNYLDPQRVGRIEIGCQPAQPGDTLQTFYVKDNGLGIPLAYRAKAFTAFQRFHLDVAKGEGIGLALVLRVVERQGGRIWFESEEGQGTTFFVALPIAVINLEEQS